MRGYREPIIVNPRILYILYVLLYLVSSVRFQVPLVKSMERGANIERILNLRNNRMNANVAAMCDRIANNSE